MACWRDLSSPAIPRVHQIVLVDSEKMRNKLHTTKAPKDTRIIIRVDSRTIKVRKSSPPPSQMHRDKTAYRRKPKYLQTEE